VVLQVAVGFTNVLLQIPAAITGLHSGLATAIVLTTMMLVREVIGAQRAPAEPRTERLMVEVG
jgi:heme A synthase